MTIEQYKKLIFLVQKYAKMYNTKDFIRVKFDSFFVIHNEDKLFKIMCNGILIDFLSSEPNDGYALTKSSITHRGVNSRSLSINHPKCNLHHDIDFMVYDDTSSNKNIECYFSDVSDVDAAMFQESLMHDYSTEYGVSLLIHKGVIPFELRNITIRLKNHLGSTEKYLIKVMNELDAYLKYMR